MADERVPTLLHLESLMAGIPASTPALGGTLAEASAVCIEAQVREKTRQTRRSIGEYPAYIVVVEFGTPQAWMEQDE